MLPTVSRNGNRRSRPATAPAATPTSALIALANPMAGMFDHPTSRKALLLLRAVEEFRAHKNQPDFAFPNDADLRERIEDKCLDLCNVIWPLVQDVFLRPEPSATAAATAAKAGAERKGNRQARPGR